MLTKEKIFKKCAEQGIRIIKSKYNYTLYNTKTIYWDFQSLSALNHEFLHATAKSLFQSQLIDLRIIFSSPKYFFANLIPISYDRENKKIAIYPANFIALSILILVFFALPLLFAWFLFLL